MEWLQGKKTYIVVALGILVNGAAYMGLIDDKMVGSIDTILMFAGMGTIRAGIAKTGK